MSGMKKKILVTDDSASIRSFIRGLLEEANYDIVEASDGEEGIKVFKKEGNIDLIVTDIYMPVKSGLELVVELKEEFRDLKVIVLSDGGTYNFSNELGVVEALGATHFMKKDLIKDKLVELVNKVISE
ncbi:response regulator [Clostridium sp. C2-6-12]|uniref:response regulator n=1 Tax=Clostridium sp. C2-6-12 TaxID=2698832 RepID=UPI00136B109B|nr:response regulator [Clostridium sp. C2-6-12]